MKFLRSFLSACIVSTFGYMGITLLSSFFWDSEPGSMDGLGYLLFSFPIYLIGTVILVIVFYIFENRINVTGIIFSGIVGILLIQILNIIFGYINAPFGSNLQTFIALYYDYKIILNVGLLVLGYVFIKKSTGWLHINGFLLGSISGFIISYVGVILFRWFDNTLTSYFYFSDKETSFVVILVVAGSFIGNVIGIKKVPGTA